MKATPEDVAKLHDNDTDQRHTHASMKATPEDVAKSHAGESTRSR